MFKNYLKTSLRNFFRNKSNTVINVSGLAIGIAACLIIYLVLNYELSFDSFFQNKDNIYRVVTIRHSPKGNLYSSGAPFPTAEALRIDYPRLKEVADIYQILKAPILVMPYGGGTTEKKFIEDKGAFYCEPQFFNIFNFKWLAGDPKTCLSEPNSAVLTKSTAEKYFGNWKDALGKSIKFNSEHVVKITGILDNVHVNSDFPLSVVVSFKTFKNDQKDDWISVISRNNCYVVLPPEISRAKFDSFLKDFVKRHKPPQHLEDGLYTQKLSDIHFDSRFANYNYRTFDKSLITALSIIALFLLIIPCVNFINLSTAQAVKRSLEVGIRKVLGGTRAQIAIQFMIEMALITIFSVVLAVIIASVGLPYVNNLVQTSIGEDFFLNPQIILFLALVTIFVIVFSGFYPAVILSGFNPITAIRGKLSVRTIGGISLRRGLVITQFIIAQILIIGVLIVVSQMKYMRNAPLGFNKEAILIVPVPTDSLSLTKQKALKNRLLQQANIKYVSYSTFTPSDDMYWNSDFKFNNSTQNSGFVAALKWADTDYFKLYGLHLIAGRLYKETDTVSGFVVTDAFVKKMGFSNPQDILGKKLTFWNGILDAPIVGVIEDYHAASLREPVSPIVMGSWKENFEMLNIKIGNADVKNTLATIKKYWSETFPNLVYTSRFLDEKIQSFYVDEQRLSVLYSIFAVIAIFISCLGLYGLVSFMAAQKTKEVGIRKVLGASTGSILYLFSKEFIILILIAFAVAAPIAYFVMKSWLNDFAYRITPGVTLFILAIAGSLFIALITVSYKALKAAYANPALSLKYE